MKSFFALFLAIMLGALGAHAQNCKVTGTVRDGLSGNPLVGAYVQAGDLISATDLDGRFELDLPQGERDVTFSYIGYAAKTLSTTLTGPTQTLDARLESLILQGGHCGSGHCHRPENASGLHQRFARPNSRGTGRA